MQSPSDFSQDCYDKIIAWRADPVKFVEQLFGVSPDVWQAEALRAYADPAKKRIAMQACAGPGKSAVLAWCGWHFLLCRAGEGEHPNGAAMSVSGDNLKNNLWKEFAIWYDRAPLLKALYKLDAEQISARGAEKTWFLAARTWEKRADPDIQGRTLSGLHSPYILYLIDEAGDINPAILRAAEQGLGNCKWGKIVIAGNPISRAGILYAAVSTQSALWHVVRITGDPESPSRSTRIDIEWAREQIRIYGRENAWVQAYILGEFPGTALNTLLGPDEVYEAMRRRSEPHEYDWSQKRLGVDCARFGDDRTVLFPRQGLMAGEPVVMRGARGPEIAARIMLAKERWGHEVELVDATGGWGHSTVDSLLTAGHTPIEVEFHAPALDPVYRNRRAEMWMKMADWVRRGGILPNLPEMVAELTTPTYTFSGGKFMLEDKDMIKKRLGCSPDLGDALALTFAIPDQPKEASLQQLFSRPNQTDNDWDPFQEEGSRQKQYDYADSPYYRLPRG